MSERQINVWIFALSLEDKDINTNAQKETAIHWTQAMETRTAFPSALTQLSLLQQSL